MTEEDERRDRHALLAAGWLNLPGGLWRHSQHHPDGGATQAFALAIHRQTRKGRKERA